MSIFSHNLLSFGKFRRKAENLARGFTLVELLAVTAIITIITLVLLLRQSVFDSTTILRSLSYSVALSVRQAQVYGVSVLGSQSGGSVQYAPAYGLYFSKTTPSSYILFADLNNNQAYDAASETVKVFSLSPGYTISEVCLKRAVSNTDRCTNKKDGTGNATIGQAVILFKRPNPDASFKNDTFANETYIDAWIQVQSAAGATRSILVTTAGQITVQPPGTLP
jgi:prepilin-type N-terminal cleavage/methylation domain-containing protein